MPIARHLAVGLVFLVLIPALLAASPTSQPDVDAALQNLLSRRLPSVQLPDVSLVDSIDFIRDVTGANIYVDWQALQLAGVLPSTTVKLSARNIPLSQAFESILKATGSDSLQIHVMHDAIVVSTILNFADRKTQKGPYLAELSNPIRPASVWDTPIKAVLLGPNTAFNDAIDFLRDITGDDVIVRWDKLKAAGIDRNTPISLNIHDAPISDVLYFILDEAGEGKLGYITEPEMRYDRTFGMRVPKPLERITISTIDDLEAAGTPASRPT